MKGECRTLSAYPGKFALRDQAPACTLCLCSCTVLVSLCLCLYVCLSRISVFLCVGSIARLGARLSGLCICMYVLMSVSGRYICVCVICLYVYVSTCQVAHMMRCPARGGMGWMERRMLHTFRSGSGTGSLSREVSTRSGEESCG